MHTLPTEEVRALKQRLKHAIYQSQESHLLHRMHCVLMVGEGVSCQRVAELFGEHPRTIQRWVDRYHTHGEAGLHDARKQGRHAKINEQQWAELSQQLSKPPWQLGYRHDHWSGKLLAHHLANRYGIELGVRQCQRLLKDFHATPADDPSPGTATQ